MNSRGSRKWTKNAPKMATTVVATGTKARTTIHWTRLRFECRCEVFPYKSKQPRKLEKDDIHTFFQEFWSLATDNPIEWANCVASSTVELDRIVRYTHSPCHPKCRYAANIYLVRIYQPKG